MNDLTTITDGTPVDQLPSDSGLTVAALRAEMDLTLLQMGEQVGLSKSQMHEVEKTGRASPDIALAIERLSAIDGKPRIDAAGLNDLIARARASAGDEGWSGGGHAPLSTQQAAGS